MAQEKKKRSADPASQEMIDLSCEQGHELAWDRYEAQQPQCDFGLSGLCCKNCLLGPCRIDPFGEGADCGVCGADVNTIAARNLARHVAAGAAAHSDHGRDLVHTLSLTGAGKTEGYKVKNEKKLRSLAGEFGIDFDGRDANEVASELASAILADFGRQEGTIRLLERAPEPLRKKWEKHGVNPVGVDMGVVRTLHATHVGGDSDPEHLIKGAIQTALGDGWGGSMYATDVSDILFGGPTPIRSQANLGVLDPKKVNVVVHGHEPTLSEMIVAASHDPEIKKKCEEAGAAGIQLSGICCTANEILMRHGIPIAGNFLQQELAISTGAVDAMVVDIQCVQPALAEHARNYKTRVISTSPKARFPGMLHVNFEEESGLSNAKTIIENAIEAFQERGDTAVHIPDFKEDLVAGYTTENVSEILGGHYLSFYRPLNHGIADGRIRGVAGVVGCNTVKMEQDKGHLEMVKELLRHDVLVVQTGCSAIACAKAGMMKPEAAKTYAGKGLQEICEAVGIPPVLHMGSCVDNSRILMACTEMVNEGGIGEDISELPVAGAAPEWMSEKAITIAMYVAASGIYTVLSESFPVMGSPFVRDYLTEGMEEDFGGKLAFQPEPVEAAQLMIQHINGKREALGLDEMLYDPVEPGEKLEEAAVSA